MRFRKVISIILIIILMLSNFVFAAQNEPAITRQLKLQQMKNTFKNKAAEFNLNERKTKYGEYVANENALPDQPFFDPDENVRVIIYISGKPIRSLTAEKKNLETLKAAQESVKASIERSGIDVEFRHQYFQSLNGISANVKYKDIKAIEKQTGVERVYICNKYELDMITSRGMVNADIVNEALENGGLGLKGEGMLVAIVDTGIDWTHEDFELSDSSKAKYKGESDFNLIRKFNETTVPEIFYTNKVVSGYDWADDDNDVIPDISKPLASSHGVHVAGTVAANGEIFGVAPEAQLLAEKVFSDEDEYAYEDDIVAAIDHAIAMNADVINMSLGSIAGFVNSGDPEQAAISRAVGNGIIVAVSAGNSGHNTKGVSLGLPYPENPDIGLAGSPGVALDTIQVAAFENTEVMAASMNYYIDEVKAGSGPYMEAGPKNPKGMDSIEIVYCGLGNPDEFTADVAGKVALVQRGSITFAEKQLNAQNAGAAGIIVYNLAAGGDGLISMATDPALNIPAVFVGLSTGDAMKAGLDSGKKVTADFPGLFISIPNPVKGEMMDGSSWGLTPDLEFKPEITAPGGNIFSTVNNNKYETMSGTSMSSPHVAGAAALVSQYLQAKGMSKNRSLAETAKKMLMNTSQIITNPDSGTPYSPRLQGAGLMKIDKAIETPVIVYDDRGKAAVSLKEIDNIKTFTLTLDGTVVDSVYSAVYYDLYAKIYTDAIDEYYGVMWNFLETEEVEGATITANGKTINSTVCEEVYVEMDNATNIEFELDLSSAAISAESFVEGFITFVPNEKNPGLPTLTVPYVGFYGEWDKPKAIDPAGWEMDSYGGDTGLYNINFETGKIHYMGDTDKYGIANPDTLAISPNGDGYSDHTTPLITFLRNAKYFKIDIVDENKKVVRELFNNISSDEFAEGMRKNSTYGGRNWFTTSPEFLWDGAANDGSVASDGQYFYRLRSVIDFPGARQQDYYMPIKVDTVGPEFKDFRIDKVAEGYKVSWDAEDYCGIMGYLVEIDGELIDNDADIKANYVIVDTKPQEYVAIIAFDYADNDSLIEIEMEDEYPDEIFDSISIDGEYVSKDRPLTINAATADNVKWTVTILDSEGKEVEKVVNQKTANEEELTTEFFGSWAPKDGFVPSGTYKVKFEVEEADKTSHTAEKTFTVYNYQILVKSAKTVAADKAEKSVFAINEQVNIEVQAQNLGPAATGAALIIQVTDPYGNVVNIGYTKLDNINSADTVTLSSGYTIARNAYRGKYKVEAYIWNDFNELIPLAKEQIIEFTVQ